ncbi:MAG: DUF3572 domain-containing protein [Rhodobacteraceae bacterium]|nr:DUF3572 domain-containing protein [Paracoccaceae bacterium]
MNRENAERVGIQVLGWLAGHDDMLTQFLGMTGIAADDLRSRASEPEFLGFVLDFLLSDDAMVMAFCEDAHMATETPMLARGALPGGDVPNWT